MLTRRNFIVATAGGLICRLHGDDTVLVEGLRKIVDAEKKMLAGLRRAEAEAARAERVFVQGARRQSQFVLTMREGTIVPCFREPATYAANDTEHARRLAAEIMGDA